MILSPSETLPFDAGHSSGYNSGKLRANGRQLAHEWRSQHRSSARLDFEDVGPVIEKNVGRRKSAHSTE